MIVERLSVCLQLLLHYMITMPFTRNLETIIEHQKVSFF